MAQTSILLRVQARGGKFLGPDIGYSFVTVRNAATGELLAQSVAAGDSGQLGTTFSSDASTNVVLSGSTVNWLAPTAGTPSPTAGFLATFDLEQPAIIEISAAGITNGVPNQNTTSARIWIWPGAQLTAEPGFILEMAGLNVEILEPNPAQPPAAGDPVNVTSWVTMMCGCKIADDLPWPTDEFTSTASLINADVSRVASTDLSIQTNDGRQVASVFTGTLACPLASGYYQLVVTAVQPSLSNSGGAAILLNLS
jgi:hypothetical protein